MKDNISKKLAQEYLANRKIQTAPQAEKPVTAAHKAEDPERVAREAEREAICARWKQVVESKCIEFNLRLPPEGLPMPLKSALSERLIITKIVLRMKLVYDKEFTRSWKGDYACPDFHPEVEVDFSYVGISADKKECILDFVGDAISSHIGKSVNLDAGYHMDEPEGYVFLECWDSDTCWNIADFLLRQNESGEEMLSDEDES